MVEKVMELKYGSYCLRGWHIRKVDRTKEMNVQVRAKEMLCSAPQFKSMVDAGLKFDTSD